MIKKIIFLMSINTAFADIQMNDRAVINVSVSKEGLSRISVDGERIENIFAHPSTVSDNIKLHESGHLFVSPKGLEGPFFLTLITENGTTQDLKISFGAQAPSPIVLKKVEAPLKKDLKEIYSEYLKVFVRGGAPQGFIPCLGIQKSCFGPWKVQGMEMTAERVFWNENLTLLEYSGEATDEMNLYPEAFTRASDLAVSLSPSKVECGNKIKVYIVRKGGWKK